MSFSISGLASGIDTASMIDQLMQLERIPYTKLETKKKDLSSSQSFFRNLNTKLNTLKTAAADLTYSSNFKQTSVNSSDETVVKVSNSTSASMGNYNIKVEQVAQNHSISSFEFAANGKSLKENTEVTIDGQKFTLTGADDGKILENLKNSINQAKVDVTASVVQTSEGNKTLVLTSSVSGTAGEINSAEGPKFTGFKAAGIIGDLKDHVIQEAKDAKLSVNGLTVTSSTNEIKNVIEGVTFTVYKEGSSVVSASTDTEEVTEKVKAFVDAFNDVRKLIRDNNSEGKSMQGDSTLRQLDMELSDWISRKVGSSNSLFLSDIGIEMDKDKKGSEMNGQLSFDEDKFKEILESDPEKIIKLFNYEGDNGKDLGIAKVLSDNLNNWTSTTNGILNSRIKGYDSEISFVDDAMESMLIRLEKKEEALKRQFTAMEVAMAQLQNEGSWLSSQLSSLTQSSN